MKKVFAVALIAALLGFGVPAHAAKVWDDMSWWGNGAGPEPVADSKGRAGYWWWPKDPNAEMRGEGTCCPQIVSAGGDTELWGNRGIVFNQWQKPEPVTPVTPKDPEKKVTQTARTLPVSAAVLFDFDKSVLKPEGKAETDKMIGEMKKYEKDTMLIEGHTCNVGPDDYNMGLGQRRADAVKAYMVESGIDAARIETKSFGETQPAVPNDTSANRKLNRRAVFKLNMVEKYVK